MRSMNDYILQARSKVDNRFYIYVHRKETDNSVFYIGKGCGSRAWNVHARNKFWKNTSAKHGFIVEIVSDDMAEDAAYELEQDLISLYKAFEHKLCNLASGGRNEKFSDYSRKKMSESKKGRPASKGSAERLRQWNISRPKVHVSENPTSDKSVYTFVNVRYLNTFCGTRWEFAEAIGKSVAAVKSFFTKRRCQSVSFGWCLLLPDETPQEAVARATTRRTTEITTIYRFTSTHAEFVGTRKEFSVFSGIKVDQVHLLFCKKPRDEVHGWKLDKEFNNETKA